MKKTIVKVLVCSWFCYLAPALAMGPRPAPVTDEVTQLLEVSA